MSVTQNKSTLKRIAAMVSMSMMALASQQAAAKTIWSDNSLSILYGEEYELVPDRENENTLTTFTFEHASGHSWGGLFYFIDRHIGEDDASGKQFNETYGEFSPKLALYKPKSGFIKSINAASTFEHGSNSGGFSQNNILLGLGADFAIPGMKYASLTFYHAKNSNTFNSEDDQQLTLTYGWSKKNVTLDGYVDYSFNNDVSEDQLHINPQLKYNVGSLFNTSKKIDAGVEYSYWKNKFGAKDKNQSAASAIVKFHF